MSLMLLLILLGGPNEINDVWSFETSGLSEYITHLADAEINEKGEIYLLDRDEHRIFHLDPNGKELSHFGRRGEGPGEFSFPSKLQYKKADKTLFVLDENKHHIISFDSKHNPVSTKIPATYDPLVLDRSTYVYVKIKDPFVAPNVGGEIYLARTDGTAEKQIYKVPPQYHQDPIKIEESGDRGSLYFPWMKRALVAGSPDSKFVFIGSTHHINFKVYDVAENKIIATIEEDQVKSPLLKEEEINDYGVGVGVGGKAFYARDFKHDQFKPPVDSVFVDLSNRLWVKLAFSWGAQEVTYLIYEDSGNKVGKLTLPSQWKIFRADKENFWAFAYNEKVDAYQVKKSRYKL